MCKVLLRPIMCCLVNLSGSIMRRIIHPPSSASMIKGCFNSAQTAMFRLRAISTATGDPISRFSVRQTACGIRSKRAKVLVLFHSAFLPTSPCRAIMTATGDTTSRFFARAFGISTRAAMVCVRCNGACRATFLSRFDIKLVRVKK